MMVGKTIEGKFPGLLGREVVATIHDSLVEVLSRQARKTQTLSAANNNLGACPHCGQWRCVCKVNGQSISGTWGAFGAPKTCYIRILGLTRKTPGGLWDVESLSSWANEVLVDDLLDWLRRNGDSVVRDKTAFVNMVWKGASIVPKFDDEVLLGWLDASKVESPEEYDFNDLVPSLLYARDHGQLFAPSSWVSSVIRGCERRWEIKRGGTPAEPQLPEQVLPHYDWVKRLEEESPGELARRAWAATKSII